jgi:hypothetical protein
MAKNTSKRTKQIKIFDMIFTINSFREEDIKNKWTVIVSYNDKHETYHDVVEDRVYAEEAAFGYFLDKHCHGGIFY